MNSRFLKTARIAAGGAALVLALIGVTSASAAILPPEYPRSTAGSDRTNWQNSWQEWAQTTLAENAGYWKPIMGARFHAPRLVFLSPVKTVQTGCGSVEATVGAMYCFNDQTIYVSTDFLARQETAYGAHAAQLILAHEYGHHIQNLQRLPGRGMLTELQADCLAGAAMSSASVAEKLDFNTLVPTLFNTTDAAGDPTATSYDHGTSSERLDALAEGWNDLSSCRLTDPSGLYFPAAM